MHTPFFPALRPRLAALGKRVQHLRQHSLAHLEQLLGPWLPPGLLSQNDQGPNSRDRIYSVRRTFFGFLYQVLKPDCPCREIVRQVQALFGLHGCRASRYSLKTETFSVTLRTETVPQCPGRS